ncbi:MAG: AAA family ATPase, partial [Oscillospiraceae bacterium]|nr:AAA family ATPase [Oscillospiraceae bacterium]
MKNDKITLEIHSIIKDLIRNIWVIILCGAIGLMGLYVASHSVYSPQYTASATMVVTAKGTVGATYANYTISSEMAEIFSKIFADPVIKNKAADKLGKGFNGSVSAAVNPGTNFIDLSVTSSSPQDAYELLNAVLDTYPDISDNIFANATITMLKAPSMPHGPSNGISDKKTLMFAFLCAALAVCCIVALSILRDTIKNESDFREKIDAKLIGVIGHENKHMTFRDFLKKRKKSLRMHSNAFISFSFIEAYHKIGAKAEYVNKTNGSKIFAITSVAENEGKSTIASNIALSLAERGNKVLLVDFDFKKPALYRIFEQEHIEGAELGDCLSGKIQLTDYQPIKYKDTSLYLALNTTSYRDSVKWIENGQVESFVEKISSEFDYVIIDTYPVSAASSITDIAKFVDSMIMVVRTDVVKTQVINDSITLIKDAGGHFGGCILNDV